MRKRTAHLLLLVSLALEASSCTTWFSKKKINPPLAPLPAPAKPAPTTTPEPTIPPPPPKIGETPASTPPNIPPDKIVTPPAPKPPRQARRRTPPKQTAEAPQIQQEAPPPAPRLGQIFTAEQRTEYNRALDESLERVRKALSAAQNRQLTEGQNNLVERIRAFEKQAMQAREQDLVSAVSLANRADVLARDLIAQLQ